ncbi:hypothetical protein ZIOFF_024028 [Zingiber officinale]|uniref:ARM repeat superfamily protein n=1 Tax=Zingiber officinale TaxID=94328 RepID=A0A8J5LFV2_ZINOF|nr:hypothetical protein ZIOFF_024028 [Zingiber officinale]
MAALAEEIGLLSTRFMEGCAHALGLFAMKSEHHQLINDAAALQPVIGLLSSCCTESQREAALLLGQFASADSECKQYDDSLALYKMASKAVMLSFVDTIPPSPTPQSRPKAVSNNPSRLQHILVEYQTENAEIVALLAKHCLDEDFQRKVK